MSNSRIFGLDILRSLAILSVLYIHCLDFFSEGTLLNYLQWFKFDGVLYFFVLSGFLIGNIMIKSFASSFFLQDLFDFWIRRWFRTLPNYYLVLILLVVAYSEYKWRIFKFIFFSQGFFKPQADFFNESWSLAVEEWFYLLFPIFLYLVFKVLRVEVKKIILPLCLIFICIIPVFRYCYFNHYVIKDILSWDYYIRQIALLRLDSIVWGVFAAYFYNFHLHYWIKIKYKALITGLSILLSYQIVSNCFPNLFWGNEPGLIYMTVFHFTLLSLAIGLLLPYLSNLRIKVDNNVVRAVTQISLASYSIYLLNYSFVKNFILPLLLPILQQHFNSATILLINIFLFYALSIGVALLLYSYFELPMMNLRDKIKIRRIKCS